MKKQLILAVAALLSATASATAGDNGRTVCVLRARPVAIQPVHRSAPSIARFRIDEPAGSGFQGIPYDPGYRVPITYGQFVQRTHYVSPFMPNGYVGGLRNLPSIVIQIPPTFGKSAFFAPYCRGFGHGGATDGGHGGGHAGGHGGR